MLASHRRFLELKAILLALISNRYQLLHALSKEVVSKWHEPGGCGLAVAGQDTVAAAQVQDDTAQDVGLAPPLHAADGYPPSLDFDFNQN